MAITKGAISALAVNDASGTSLTTASIDTTGAGLLVVVVSFEGAADPSGTVTDNKSNTSWVDVGRVNHSSGGASGDMTSIMFAHYAPSVGTGHTVTYTHGGGGSRPFRRLALHAANGTFSNGAALDAQLATQGNTGVSIDAGSLTTTAASIFFQWNVNYAGESMTPTGGYISGDEVIESNGRELISRIEAAPVTGFDPSASTVVAVDWNAILAAFKETTGAAVLTVENATTTLTGQTVIFDSNIGVTTAAATFTGQTVVFVEATGIGVQEGTITFSGQDVSLIANAATVIAVTEATATLQGQDLPFILETPWTEPTLLLTGQDITLTAGVPFTLAVTEATFSFAGQAVNFILDEDYTVSVTEATLAFAGQDVVLSALTSFLIDVGQSNVAFAGQNVDLFTPYSTASGASGGRRCRDRAIPRLITGR